HTGFPEGWISAPAGYNRNFLSTRTLRHGHAGTLHREQQHRELRDDRQYQEALPTQHVPRNAASAHPFRPEQKQTFPTTARRPAPRPLFPAAKGFQYHILL